MIWYALLMHAFYNLVPHMLFPVVGVAAVIYKHRCHPFLPFHPKIPRRTGQHPKALLGTLSSGKGCSVMWKVRSTPITHIIFYSKADVLLLARGLVKSTQTRTLPHMFDRDCYLIDKQAEDGHRETRHRVGRASRIWWPTHFRSLFDYHSNVETY